VPAGWTLHVASAIPSSSLCIILVPDSTIRDT
jgi:hypothetical protein